MTWEDHWATGDTPWDIGGASPCLTALVRSLQASPGGRALVPGCGSGYDVFLLAQAGFVTVGLDVAPSARARFEELRQAQSLNEERSQIRIVDFFETTVASLGGPFDFIWEYTFFCAIDPVERPRFKAKVLELLAPGGTLAMLNYPVVPEAPKDEGPPFPVDPEEVKALLSPELERVAFQAPHDSHPRRAGKEWLALYQRVSQVSRPLPGALTTGKGKAGS